MDQDGEKSNTGFQVLNGVSANFHIYLVKTSYSLSPLTSSTGTASPISLKSSSVSFTSNDSMLLLRFLSLVVPVEFSRNGKQRVRMLH